VFETIETDLQAPSAEIGQVAFEVSTERDTRQPKRTPLPANPPRTDIHHEPESTACRCGCQMQRIGEDVAKKLDYQPGVFTVERHVRGK
jgi:transposase